MLRIKSLGDFRIDIGEPIPGVNDGQTMALNWLGLGREVLGRGVRKDGTSCIFQGKLTNDQLAVEPDPILSPEKRSATKRGERIYGYEDPSRVLGYQNFVTGTMEPGFFCTEAYYAPADTEGRQRIHTNLLYSDMGGNCQAVAGPYNIAYLLGGPVSPYGPVDMVKEPCFLNTSHGRFLLMEMGAELGGQRQSRIVIGTPSHESLGSVRPYFEPEAGTEWDAHTSTVGDSMVFPGTDLSLLLLNGAKRIVVDGHETNRWAIFAAIVNYAGNIVWRTSRPIITPPEGIEPGPGGQLIAFGSDNRVAEAHDRRLTVEILYHAMDRYPCRAIVEFALL